MVTLTEEQIEKLVFSYKMGLKAYGLRNPVEALWLYNTEQGLSNRQVLHNVLESVLCFATGKLALCEVSHVANEVTEEFGEEAAT